MNTFNPINVSRRHLLLGTAACALLPGTHAFAAQTPVASPVVGTADVANFDDQGVAALYELLAAAVADETIPGGVLSLSLPHETRVFAMGEKDVATGAPIYPDTIFRVMSFTKAVTAVVMLQLLDEGAFALDDPIDTWLPELADRQVLVNEEGPLDDTVPADRSITVEDVLMYRTGYGMMMDQPPSTPIHLLMAERGIAPGAQPPQEPYDNWLAKFADVPLLHQPGAAWRYETAADFQGILISRVENASLSDVFERRVFAPVGMPDTGFYVPADNIARLGTAYMDDYETGQQVVFDAVEGAWSAPPVFEAGNGGLVSTVSDWNRFARMLLTGGEAESGRIVSAEAVAAMTSDQLTPEQKANSPWFPGFWDTHGWGYGVAITTESMDPAISPGQYGWDGGLGTSWISDPNTGLIATLYTQKLLNEALFGLIAQFQALAPLALKRS